MIVITITILLIIIVNDNSFFHFCTDDVVSEFFVFRYNGNSASIKILSLVDLKETCFEK